jgi:hypothetical protein
MGVDCTSFKEGNGRALTSAVAYIGPGAGLELAGSFFSLLAWVGVLFSAVLLWPLHALVRWLRGKRKLVGSVTVEAND